MENKELQQNWTKPNSLKTKTVCSNIANNPNCQVLIPTDYTSGMCLPCRGKIYYEKNKEKMKEQSHSRYWREQNELEELRNKVKLAEEEKMKMVEEMRKLEERLMTEITKVKTSGMDEEGFEYSKSEIAAMKKSLTQIKNQIGDVRRVASKVQDHLEELHDGENLLHNIISIQKETTNLNVRLSEIERELELGHHKLLKGKK